MVEASYDSQNWDIQAEEIESLTYIYPEELTVVTEKPYKIELRVNSNCEEDKNFLKLILTFELPVEYPNSIPYFRIKNLCVEYMDNALLDKYETQMKKKAEESLG